MAGAHLGDGGERDTCEVKQLEEEAEREPAEDTRVEI